MKINKRIIAIIATMALLLTAVIFSASLSASAQNFDDTNPDLTKVDINGTIETEQGLPAYTPNSTFKQDGDKYTLSSDAYCAWGMSDDVTFAYKEYPVAARDSDSLTVEADVNELSSDTPGNTLHPNASAGIMIRSGLEPTSASVFLHVRQEGVMIVYRQSDQGGYTFVSAKQFTYPVSLKMVVKKNTVECRYKNAGETKWRLSGYVSIKYTGPLYAGICTHSVDPNTHAKGVFQNLKMYGSGTYDPNEDPGSSSSSSSTVTEPVDPDLDLSGNSNIVLYETFSNDKKQAIAKDYLTGADTTYSWTNGHKSYASNKFTNDAPSYSEKAVVKGNRFLYKQLTQDSIDFVGDERWSDYKVSMDVQFTEKCDPSVQNAANLVALSARSRIVEWYGYSDYAATMQHETLNGKDVTTVSLYKHVNDAIGSMSDKGIRLGTPVVVDNFIGDGKWHNIGISVFDNIIKVYYDGEEVISYVDDGLEIKDIPEGGSWEEIIGFGNVGVKTYQTDCYIDNIIVEMLPDTINGDYDNYVGGNWDEPIPDSVKNWIKNGNPYYFSGINGDNSAKSKK